MEGTPLHKRLTILIGVFLFVLLSGVTSMHLFGGATGDLANDFYLVVGLFVVEGNWTFEGPSNLYLKTLAFIAPLVTMLGVIELITKRLLGRWLQGFKLLFIKDHVVILGLKEESYLLVKSLMSSSAKKDVVVVDKDPDPILSLKCRKMGVPVIEGSPTSPKTLSQVQIARASLAVSFIVPTPEAISMVFSFDKVLRKEGSKPLDLWLNFDDPEYGRRLGDYLKFANLSTLVHPRFFNLNEVAARRLVRQHPPDLYADIMGHDRLHLAVYGFGNLAFEVVEEILLQSTSFFKQKTKISILSENPDDDRAMLLALSPQIETVADVSVEPLKVFSTGLAQRDYDKIPKDVTMHIVCHKSDDANAAIGLSLRQLLLNPPQGKKWRQERRLNAPIFVRLSRARGIAQLLESHLITGEGGKNEARGDIPDGIVAFGMLEDLLLVDQDDPMIPTVVDSMREEAAKFLHFSYVYDVKTLKDMFDGIAVGGGDVAQDWEDLGPVFRESCRQEADHIWAKARLLRYRLSPLGDPEKTESELSTDEKKKIAVAEHTRWLTERRLAGWVFNKKRVDEAKRHNLLRPWEELSEDEAKMDLHLAERINAAARHSGVKLRRELSIGVVGHRFAPGRPFDEEHVKRKLSEEIDKLMEKYPDRDPVLYTHLADGADTLAAEVALERNIPFVAPLPLPFETYKRDFLEAGQPAVNTFLDLISKTDMYYELPQKFGGLVETAGEGKPGQMSPAREDQYALGGAFIVERCDELIAVWDGKKARGTGGTADVVEWRQAQQVPEKYQSPDIFDRNVEMKPPIIIKPTPD